MKLKTIVASLGLLGSLSGCASIVGESSQTLTFATTPAQADLRITDEMGRDVYQGQTPTTVDLRKSDGSYFGGKTYQVSVSKVGFQPRHFTIDSHANGWYIAGNLVFGGLIGWLVVDPFSGAMYKLSPSDIDTDLDKNVASLNDGDNVVHLAMLEDIPQHMQAKMVKIGNI